MNLNIQEWLTAAVTLGTFFWLVGHASDFGAFLTAWANGFTGLVKGVAGA